ncbi:MAG: bifunctional folylpolyglutamate synthase/dihydrofolate synthase [Candidatus Omnitrophica bacterium]|nr:bifunctional folylpolyglutamate synthase/dihydrofolate synthase [Candidatus Omnitrophota bacterium]
MDYKSAVSYIDSFINFEKIPRYSYASSFQLERMHAFLRELGNPHKDLKILHIAGSKGKGSVCAIAAAVLKHAGYRTGLYTSPHLLDVRERIRVPDQDSKSFSGTIKKEEFIELVGRMKPVAEKFREHKELGRLSFFEFLTAVAFIYFKEKKVDYAVLETGLGGRLDATNVTGPMVCGITDISLEHTDKLGNSLSAIAGEKAGIIKSRCVVVSASQPEEAGEVIRDKCKEKKVKLLEVGKDIIYSILEACQDRQFFDIKGEDFLYKKLEINLRGRHQVENAALAIGMLRNCVDLDENALRAGLKGVQWPGRLQVVKKEPYVILDGAQNVASIRTSLSSIKEIFVYRRMICAFGISSDKDIKGVCGELDNAGNVIILTRSVFARAADPQALKNNFSKATLEVTESVDKALSLALSIAGKEDLILVTGSLYVVGEAMKFFNVKV